MASQELPDRNDDNQPSSKIGEDVHTGREVFISLQDRERGLGISGITGAGKSVLVHNLIDSDLHAGRGLILIEPFGDLTRSVIASIPEERLDNVIYVDLEDDHLAVGLNLFECADPTDSKEAAKVADFAQHVFEKVWEVGPQTPQLAEILRQVTATLIENQGATFYEIPFLLRVDAVREAMVKRVTNPHTQMFWQEYNRKSKREREDFIASTLNRVGQYFQNHILMNIVSQPKSTIDFRALMDQSKILLVRLSPQFEQASRLLGAILVAKMLMAAYSRESISEQDRTPWMIYCDEFQRFSFKDFTAIIDEAGRKFDCPVTIAYQGLSQLDEANKAAAQRVGSLAVFRVSGPDADIFVKNFDRTPPKEPAELEPVRAIVSDGISHLVRLGYPEERVARFAQFQLLNFEAFMREHEPYAYHSLYGTIPIHPVTLREGRQRLNETLSRCMREQNPQVAIPPLALYLLAVAQKDGREMCLERLVQCKSFLDHHAFDGFSPGAEKIGEPAFVHPDAMAKFLTSFRKKKDRSYAEALIQLLTELRYCLSVLAREPILEATGQYQLKYESISSAETERRIANALTQQPQFQARVRLASQAESVIRTKPLPRHLTNSELNARIEYIKQRMLKLGYCKDVQEVARERAVRLDQLHKGIPVEPPPTHIKGNTQIALPPEQPEREAEAPPTHISMKKTPEEAPSLPAATLQLESLTFYASGTGVLPQEQRRYSTHFPPSAARYILYELWARNGQRQHEQSYQVEQRLFSPNGELMGTGQQDWVITSGDDRRCYSWGWGWEKAGHWEPGDYRVEVLINGVTFAEGSFTIEEPPPAPTLRLESLKFFESSKDYPQKEQRVYRLWFPKEQTRYVTWEITVRNGLYQQRDQTYQLVERYYNPDGSVRGTDRPYDWVITSDREQTWLTWARGWDEPGNWEPGDYRVEILIDGVAFAEGMFKILKPRRRRNASEADRAQHEQERQEQERKEFEERAHEVARQKQIDEQRQRELQERRHIERWNQHFMSYRGTKQRFRAQFVFRKLGLNLSDDTVGEKFFERFWRSVPEAERQQNYIKTIAEAFTARQLNQYKDILDPLTSLFENANTDSINAKIREKKEDESLLQKLSQYTEDENWEEDLKNILRHLWQRWQV